MDYCGVCVVLVYIQDVSLCVLVDVQLYLFDCVIQCVGNGIVIVVVCQLDELIIFVNCVFECMIGYSVEEVIGCNC